MSEPTKISLDEAAKLSACVTGWDKYEKCNNHYAAFRYGTETITSFVYVGNVAEHLRDAGLIVIAAARGEV